MTQAAHTPTPALSIPNPTGHPGPIDTLADVLWALERTPALGFGLTVLREAGDDQATVCVRADGGTWFLDPAMAVDVAAALRAEQAFVGAATVARAFEDRALEARQLDALIDAAFAEAPSRATPSSMAPMSMAQAPLPDFLRPHAVPVWAVIGMAIVALSLALSISLWPGATPL